MLLPGEVGGGEVKAEVLNGEAKTTMGGGGGSMRGGLPFSFWGVWGLPWNVLKIYVSESAFQAILKPIFPYSITSILSKFRHSKK